MPAAGRKQRTTAIEAEPVVDEKKLDGAIAQMRVDAKEELAELCDLAGNVKAIQMAELTANFLAAAKVRLFEQVRKSRKIKDLPIRQADGTFATAKDLEQFCPMVFGRPYTAMAEASQTLEALGEQAYDTANRLGLNRSALRAARALPPEQLETVRLAIAGGSTKSEILSVIEDLAVKVEQAEAALTEVKAEKEAGDQLLAKRNAKIDTLEKKLKRIDKLPPDDALGELLREAQSLVNDAMGCIRGGLRQAIVALRNHSDEDHTVILAGMVGQVQADLTALRDEFDLPDVSGAGTAALAAEVAQWAGKPAVKA